MNDQFDALLSLCLVLHNRHKNAFERLSESDQQEWLAWIEQARTRLEHMQRTLREARLSRAEARAAGLAPLSRPLRLRDIGDLRAGIGMVNDMRRAHIPVALVPVSSQRDWPAEVWSATGHYLTEAGRDD